MLYQPSFKTQTQSGYQPDLKAKRLWGSHFSSERISSQIIFLPLCRPFPSISHLWGKSDIRAAPASALAQSIEPLTDRGHWGSASGVTVSCGTWGCSDKELWHSVGLVSALVTGENAAAALKAAAMTEAAVTFCAVLKFQACPFPYIQRPPCSHSCCLGLQCSQILETSFFTLLSLFFIVRFSSEVCWPKLSIAQAAWNAGYTQWMIAVTQTVPDVISARGYILKCWII